MAEWGYARVSKGRYDTDRKVAHNLRVEIKKLTDGGLAREQIVAEVISGTKRRPAFERLLTETMQPGDVLVVSNLARLSRSAKVSEWALEVFEERNLDLRCLREDIDTRSPGGRMIFRIIAAINQAQAEAIGEDSKAGQDWARGEGKHIGRPVAITAEKGFAIRNLRKAGASLAAIAVAVGVSASSVKNYCRDNGISKGAAE